MELTLLAMKKIFSLLLGWIFAGLAFVACVEPDDFIEDTTIKVSSVTLSAAELSLTVGDSHALTAVVSPDDASDKSVVWHSSDPSVARVSSSGVVTAVGAGTASITATAGDKSATCVVTVKQKGGGMDASIDSWDDGENYEGTVN
mgnify:CR=1 FL=1